MRAFLAVVPPRPVREAVEAIREPLKELTPQGRWVHPSLWHVTLKFLGEVEDDLVPAVIDLAGELAGRHDAFDVSLQDLGMFPHPDRARAFWVGIKDGKEQLRAIARSLDEGLDGLGFEPENKAFQAHLTIARFREPREAGPLLPHVGPTEEIGRFVVDSIVLMRSVLRPRGPDYSVIDKLDLIPRPEPEPAEGEADEPAEEQAEAATEADEGEADEPAEG
ncbi:MAG: RNA 2',3'-cyclic phosphodiesterase [Armatimonadetes bacterium]|nr:RNA 2',3'-cyclic phosphodiesterase [Armatimonadota bacterium]